MRNLMITNPDGTCTFRECGHCKYDKEYCTGPEYGIEACPVFSAVLHKLAAYEDLADIDLLRKKKNEETLRALSTAPGNTPKYLYASHMGGYYLTMEQRPIEELYCDECGDSDELKGQVRGFLDAWKLVNGDSDPLYWFSEIFPLFYPEVKLLGTFDYPWYSPEDSEDEDDDWIDTVTEEMVREFVGRFEK